MDISKEAEPSELVKSVLPILQQNGVVHFLGFGNRLGFDSVPVHLQVTTCLSLFHMIITALCFVITTYERLLQRLRCRCNFHALKFVPELQRAGSLLVQRLRKAGAMQTEMDKQLFGSNMLDPGFAEDHAAGGPSRFLALHMRFEEDMVAYSLCEFGGGEEERRELQAYRETHFPALATRLLNAYVHCWPATSCRELLVPAALSRTFVLESDTAVVVALRAAARCRRRSSVAWGGAR